MYSNPLIVHTVMEMWACVCAPHLAGLQHIDLLFIHRVLVLRQEAFTLVLHLLDDTA